jgi:hypothetical protein
VVAYELDNAEVAKRPHREEGQASTKNGDKAFANEDQATTVAKCLPSNGPARSQQSSIKGIKETTVAK